jgi:hypothetical protein
MLNCIVMAILILVGAFVFSLLINELFGERHDGGRHG